MIVDNIIKDMKHFIKGLYCRTVGHSNLSNVVKVRFDNSYKLDSNEYHCVRCNKDNRAEYFLAYWQNQTRTPQPNFFEKITFVILDLIPDHQNRQPSERAERKPS